MTIFTVLVLLILFKAAKNIVRILRCRILLRHYRDYLAGKNPHFAIHKAMAIKLLQDAGIRDDSIPVQTSFGPGGANITRASLFRSLANEHSMATRNVEKAIFEATGVYYLRLKETFSIFYWVDYFVHLPRNLLVYLAPTPPEWIKRLLDAIWWIVAPIFLAMRTRLFEYLVRHFPW